MYKVFLYVTTHIFKEASLYRYTLIIDHKSCNMLSIPNKLTLQKELHFVSNNVFLDKKHNNIKTQKNQI